jgi:hypothetical protein
MYRIGLLWFMLFVIYAPAWAQKTPSLPRQCGTIREIIYQSKQNNFANIIDQRLRSSSGYQTNGQWTFSNERYSTSMVWPGAVITVIEHATDERDSSYMENWQYIATFEAMPDRNSAADFFDKVVYQIDDCVLPLSDSVTVNLRTVDPQDLSPNMPAELAAAYVYILPDAPALRRETSIMVGLERAKGGLRPLIIVEVMYERKK